MDEDRPIRLTTNANIVRGLLAIVRRAAMSEFEAMQVETVFGDWFRQIEDQSKQFAALDRLAALARDQPPAEPPAGATGDVFDGDGGPLGSLPDEASSPQVDLVSFMRP